MSDDVTTQKRFDTTDDVIDQGRFNGFNVDVTPLQQRLDISDKKIVNKRVLFGLMMDHNNQVSIKKLGRFMKIFKILKPRHCFLTA